MKHLQFLTHATDRYTELEEVKMALQGGCRWIQLRMKGAPANEILAVGKEAVSLCHRHRAILILDDRVALCPLIGADGVHLGRHDMPVAAARKILGPQSIIGATVNTVEDLRRAVDAGADYVGCGPFRFTIPCLASKAIASSWLLEKNCLFSYPSLPSAVSRATISPTSYLRALTAWHSVDVLSGLTTL